VTQEKGGLWGPKRRREIAFFTVTGGGPIKGEEKGTRVIGIIAGT